MPFRSAVRTWLQLLRAPNLLTVPGDPLAGFLLASGGHLETRLGLAILASLCAYGFGLLLNDLADLAEDRRERPSRPLPSGAASILAVRAAAGALGVAALLASAAVNPPTLVVCAALLVAVIAYNFVAKKIAVVGPLTMGLCRGASVLLGACAALPATAILGKAMPPLAWAAGASITIHILAVTHLARNETSAAPSRATRAMPFAGLLFAVVPFFLAALDRAHWLAASNLALYAVSAYTLYAGYKIHLRLVREPAPPIPPMIGQLIRLLLPLQAACCLASRSLAGAVAAVVLLALWPVSRAVSRRFYAS